MRFLRCFVVHSLYFADVFVFERRYGKCYADSFLNKSSLHPFNIEEHIHGEKCILKFLPGVVDKMLSGVTLLLEDKSESSASPFILCKLFLF